MPLGRERYYVDKGRAHDYLLRCKDCQELVPFTIITKLGCCPGTPEKPCGNKRFNEITLLSEKEMADIKAGIIDFEDREAFLAEFEPVDEKDVKVLDTLALDPSLAVERDSIN